MNRAVFSISLCLGLAGWTLQAGDRIFTTPATYTSTPIYVPQEDDLIRGMGMRRVSYTENSACMPNCPPCPTSPPNYGLSTNDFAPQDPSMPQQPAMTDFPDLNALGNPNYVAVSPGGYLDVAAPVTMFRLRFDDAQNMNFPDRGEYFYAKCGCFRDMGIDPNAKGPSGLNDSVSYRALRTHLEYAFSPKFSVFAELPVQWVHFSVNPGDGTNNPNADTTSPVNSAGYSDMNAGFKYAFIAERNRYLTFQLRTYIPTGDSYQGLGTGHVSLEPGLLYYHLLTERLIFQAEFKDFIPVSVSSFASNVLEYGGGLGYIVFSNDRVVVTPMFEVVGWTFLGGEKFNPVDGLHSADGDTIINVKPGVRVGFGDPTVPAGQQRHSIYFGWGHPITSDRLYEDIYRIEYRLLF